MTEPSVPYDEWHRDAIFYEVPVKAFFDSNGDGIGDFAGLTSRLDYIRDLGATCLWLLPFYPSPLQDDGYDVSDYRAVRPSLGTIDDFRRFVEEAHRRDLRIAAELVVNHTSDQHPWYRAARASPPDSPLREFYVWNEGEPEGEQSVHWSWDPVAKAWYFHRFFEHEPDLNYACPQVREEMLKVLRFWLDLGVDMLCLAGASFVGRTPTVGRTILSVPSQRGPVSMASVRERTDKIVHPTASSTLDVLRQFRREIDAAYPGRVLQAGLNAWPDEAAAFFGDGDVCQLVPHLALAQRLFLALAQESAFPIVDILRRTPPIPEGCQWALFLRNHDELTLSLATDEEQDYMYRQYAADPRLRLHAGILRRLAPLLENNRPQFELLFGLLLSLPGTPVIYYGDELGMGDNVFLGNRDGVRNPMQWSADRNGGFSTADFAHLYAPPVLDPVYGHAAVNVEAQQRDSSSRYHWLRRLIAVRKNSPVLSRGSLEILETDNPRVLAIVRHDGGDPVAVVANLSRAAQAVALDLSRFEGRVPVEMLGHSTFPTVDRNRYRLTLAAGGFFWLRLQVSADEVPPRLAPVPVEQVDVLPALRWSGDDRSLPGGSARDRLERDVLPGYLRSQRWFGGKARRIHRVAIADEGVVTVPQDEGGPTNSWLSLLRVAFENGGTDDYLLPLSAAFGPEARRIEHELRPWSVARLETSDRKGLLFDALADGRVCQRLLDTIGNGTEIPTLRGRIRGIPTSAFADLRGNPESRPTVVRGPATSSNSLVFFGRRLLMKLFRRLEPGINPDVEIGRYLTEETSFDRTPRVAGLLEYVRPGAEPVMLAILQELIPNQGDGWKHAIDELARYYDRAFGRLSAPDPVVPDRRSVFELSAVDPPATVLEVLGPYLHAARTLGHRTAELHLALGQPTSNPAFAPEPLAPADLKRIRESVIEGGRHALDLLQTNRDRLPEDVASDAARLIEAWPRQQERLQTGSISSGKATRIRVHGDYHLGQVLWAENDYVILDFEGEPTRTVEERRRKQSPLKDVAGMLRSYHYAAWAGLFAFTRDRQRDFARLEPWAEIWQQWTSAAFLGEYRRVAGTAAFIPQDADAFRVLLDAFLLDKAVYELAYELNNRPDWVRIPLKGVLEKMASSGEVHSP